MQADSLMQDRRGLSTHTDDAPNGSEYRKARRDRERLFTALFMRKTAQQKRARGAVEGVEKKDEDNATNRRHCRDCSSPVRWNCFSPRRFRTGADCLSSTCSGRSVCGVDVVVASDVAASLAQFCNNFSTGLGRCDRSRIEGALIVATAQITTGLLHFGNDFGTCLGRGESLFLWIRCFSKCGTGGGDQCSSGDNFGDGHFILSE